MSLVVWLPLTKDLRNQGLDNVTVTNNGATFNLAGKLGGCYNFNNSAIGIGATNITLGNTFSITCWIKVNSYNLNWANAFKIYKDDYDYIGLCMARTSDSTKQLGFHIYKNDGSNARTNVYDAYHMPLTIGTWYHLCFVVTPSEVKTYQNGVNIRTGSITTTFPSVSNYSLGLGKSSLFNGLDCSINDFRLYNHALSQMEVKELSKGLVLHYPLSRGGLGQENQFKNSNFVNGTNSWYGVNSSSIRVETKDGYTCATGTKGTSNNIIGQTSASYTGGTVIDITVSAKVYVTETGTFSIGHWISTSQASGWQGMSGSTVWNTTNNLSVGWNYISVTRKNSTSQYTGNIVTAFGYTGATFWITDVKFEFGDKATPWCPNSSDALATTMGLNSTTEYDCSGFCNNGTRTGTFTWTSDTPKYEVSTYFGGSSCIDTNIDYLGNEWSYGCWVYSPASSRSWEGLFMLNGQSTADADIQMGFYTYPKGARIQNTANGKFNSSISYSYGSWHHLFGTYDGAILKTYIDGELINSTSITQAHLERHNLVIGARHGSGTSHDCFFQGNICDARIYATALSADDVKSLYQNSAYIDSSGNVYGAVHEEV